MSVYFECFLVWLDYKNNNRQTELTLIKTQICLSLNSIRIFHQINFFLNKFYSYYQTDFIHIFKL